MGELVDLAAVLDGARAELERIRERREEIAAAFPIPDAPMRMLVERWPAFPFTAQDVDGYERVFREHPPEYVMAVAESVVASAADRPPSPGQFSVRCLAFDVPAGRLMVNGVRWKPEPGATDDPPGAICWRRVAVPEPRDEPWPTR